MKKIVFLHPPYFEQAMGGAEYQISLLIEFLKQQSPGVEIHHIFEDSRKPVENRLQIHLHPLRKIKLNKRFGNRWFLYRKNILLQLKAIKPDVIYTRFFSSWSGIAADYAKENGCLHIWAIASDHDVVRLKESVPISKALEHIENKWVRKAFKHAGVILTQNSYQQELLKSVHGREGILIRQSNKICPKDKIIKSPEMLNVCWIANLKPIKQPELFLELARRFNSHPGITFTMIGRPDNRYLPSVEELSHSMDNFQYLGELSNDEVNNRLCENHVLVNTSLYEGFSNTFVQAWMRKVVVMSMNSDPDNLLTAQKMGFLLHSMNEMEAKLNELMQNRQTLNEIGQRAFEHAIEHHDYEKNMRVLTKIMKINE